MPFKANYEGVKEAGGANFAPAGVYLLRIESTEERTSRNGDPQVSMKLHIHSGTSKGSWSFHTVTFFAPDAKGAGFSKKFLKAIGMPHEGAVTVDPTKWNGKVFKGELDLTRNDKGYDNNSLTNNYWSKDDENSPDLGLSEVVVPKPTTSVEPVEVKGDLEEVPF